MKLLIISTAPFILKDEKCFAYSPYVKELVIWEKYVNEVSFCCPVWQNQNGLLVDFCVQDMSIIKNSEVETVVRSQYQEYIGKLCQYKQTTSISVKNQLYRS